jgi:hypothetical protein
MGRDYDIKEGSKVGNYGKENFKVTSLMARILALFALF